MDEMVIRWQYCGSDGYEAERVEDASEVRAWYGAHGDTVALVVTRTPRGRWAIDTSDTEQILVSWYAKRFASPSDALSAVCARSGMTFREAVCRCGTAGAECD